MGISRPVMVVSSMGLVLIGCTNLTTKLCMFSEVQGVATRNGEPIGGATIERTYRWGSSKGETGVDVVRSGPDGKFSFPPVFRRSLLAALLPHNPRI